MKKDNFFQVIRGISIICVVLIHSLLSVENNEYISNYNIILRQIINFCVAVFIFMSGYFINIEELKNNPRKYILKKLKRLIIPFLLWSLIYTFVNLFMMLLQGKDINIIKIIIKFMIGSSACQLYFVLALIQLILITPFLINNESLKRRFVILSLTPIYLVIVELYNLLCGKQLPLYATICLAWLIFYYIGILVKQGKIFKFSDNKRIAFLILALIFILLFNSAISLLFYSKINYALAVSQVRIISMIYSIIAIMLIINLKNAGKEINNKLLVIIGNYSFGIYLSHVLYLQVFRKIFEVLNINMPIVINEVVLTSMIIATSCIVIKLFKNTKLKIFFGY